MKLPDEYVAMLEEHCEKLQEIEDALYEQWKETGDKDVADSWLQAQQQLRLTTVELNKQGPIERKPIQEEAEQPTSNSNAEKRAQREQLASVNPVQLIAALRNRSK